MLLSAAIALGLAVLAWLRRPARGTVPFSVLMVAVAEISLAYVPELAHTDVEGMVFWAKLQYLGFVTLAPAWLAFALEYTGRGNWLTRRNSLLLAIEPVATLLIVWTNEWHHWFYAGTVVHAGPPAAMLDLTYGPYFWVQGAYMYALMSIGAILMLQEFLATAGLYRRQALIVLISLLLPWTANALYLVGLNPWPHLHLTAPAFALSGILIVWGLFRYQLLDIMPIARGALVDGMDDALIVLDGQERVVDFNRAAERLIGSPAARAIGQPAARVMAVWPAFVQHIIAGYEARGPIELAKGDPPGYYELRQSTLSGASGQVTGRMFVLRDITDRKRAEQAEREQRALAEALRDAAASLASMLDLDAVMDGILAAVARVLPHDYGCIMLIEGEDVRIVRAQDYTQQGVGGLSVGLTIPISAAADLRQMLAAGQPVAVPDTAGYPGWVPLCETSWIRSHIAAPVRVKGQTIGFLNLDSATPGFFGPADAARLQAFADQAAVAVENAQLYSSLGKSNAELQAAASAKDQMVRNVSHELRGPLTVLMACLEVLGTGDMGPLGELQQQTIEVMRVQATQLQHTVERILTLQTFAPEKLQRAPLALGPWLERQVGGWEARALAARVRLHLQMPREVPLVFGDRYYLSHVIDNLLENALKFSPGGGDVVVRLSARDGEVVMAVCDQGVGIAPDELSRIFDRFYQIDGSATRRFGGIGIGLALCQAIVEGHGGRIWAESAGEGRGSSVYVALATEPAGVPGA